MNLLSSEKVQLPSLDSSNKDRECGEGNSEGMGPCICKQETFFYEFVIKQPYRAGSMAVRTCGGFPLSHKLRARD